MTDDSEPPKPKRRRKPPPGIETGYPEDEGWTESAPVQSESVVVDPTLETPPVTAPIEAPAEAFVEEAPIAAPIEAAPLADISSDSGRVAVAQLDSAPYAVAPPPEPTWQQQPPQPFQGFEPLPSQVPLQEAVGAKKKKREVVTVDYDDFDDAPRKSRKMIVVSALSLVVGLGIAALVFLGRSNSSWFYISCEPDKIVAQQGRSFPPWGESALGGKQWTAIKIPADAECIALETEDEGELSTQFRTMLVKRASVLLTAKEVTKTDEANALLEQALLHARSNTDVARNARTEIQRLLGDVAYWRASLKMRDASKALIEAAKQFDSAAQQRPRHVTDASAWADYVRKVVGELEAGPAGSTQTVFPPIPPPTGEQRTPAPAGVALPVEPDKGSASEAPVAPPDAGLPTGGVLL